MTLLNNPNFISFDGTPITGRTPTQTIVMSDGERVEMSPQLRAEVAHAYKLFCDAVNVSAIPMGYHVQNRKFNDGSKCRMESNKGIHKVMVWPVGGGEDEEFIMLASPRYVGGFFNGDPSEKYVYSYSAPTKKKIKRIDKQIYSYSNGLYPLEKQPGNSVWFDSRDEEKQTSSSVSWWCWHPSRYTPDDTPDRVLDGGFTTSWFDTSRPLHVYVDGEMVKTWSASGGKTVLGACLHYKVNTWVVRVVIQAPATTVFELHEFAKSNPASETVTTVSYNNYGSQRLVAFNSSGTKFCFVGQDAAAGRWNCTVEMDFSTHAVTTAHRGYVEGTETSSGDLSPVSFTPGSYSTSGYQTTFTWNDTKEAAFSTSNVSTYHKTLATDYIGDSMIVYKSEESYSTTASANVYQHIDQYNHKDRITGYEGFWNAAHLYLDVLATASDQTTHSFRLFYDVGGAETTVFNLAPESESSRTMLVDMRLKSDWAYRYRSGVYPETWEDLSPGETDPPASTTATAYSNSGNPPVAKQVTDKTNTAATFTIIACDPRAKYVSLGTHSWTPLETTNGKYSATITVNDYVDTDMVFDETKSYETEDINAAALDVTSAVAGWGVYAGLPYNFGAESYGWINSIAPTVDYVHESISLQTDSGGEVDNRFSVGLVNRIDLPVGPSYSSGTFDNDISLNFGTGFCFSTNVSLVPTTKYSAFVVSNSYFGETDEGRPSESRLGMADPRQWRPGVTIEDMNNNVILSPLPDFGITSCYHYHNGTTYPAKEAVEKDYADTPPPPYRTWLSSPIFIPKWKLKK